jgi:hypothetical protein
MSGTGNPCTLGANVNRVAFSKLLSPPLGSIIFLSTKGETSSRAERRIKGQTNHSLHGLSHLPSAPNSYNVNLMLPTLPQVTIVFAIAGACLGFALHRIEGEGPSLEVVLSKLLSASLIPTGAMLLLCAFDTSLLSSVEDVGLYIAAAGIMLLVVAIKTLSK